MVDVGVVVAVVAAVVVVVGVVVVVVAAAAVGLDVFDNHFTVETESSLH